MVYCVDKEHMDEVMKVSRILLEFWMATCNKLLRGWGARLTAMWETAIG